MIGIHLQYNTRLEGEGCGCGIVGKVLSKHVYSPISVLSTKKVYVMQIPAILAGVPEVQGYSFIFCKVNGSLYYMGPCFKNAEGPYRFNPEGFQH